MYTIHPGTNQVSVVTQFGDPAAHTDDEGEAAAPPEHEALHLAIGLSAAAPPVFAAWQVSEFSPPVTDAAQ